MTQHIETTKHTSGPWHVNPIRPTAGTSILDSKSDLVASAFNKPSPESEANARLIAAAPELLERLLETKELLTRAMVHLPLGALVGFNDLRLSIDATITKATQQ